MESLNAKEASKDAAKHGTTDGIGGAGLPKAAGKPPGSKVVTDEAVEVSANKAGLKGIGS